MSLRNLSIAPRAALGFGLVALLVILLGMFSLLQMSEMRKQSAAVDSNWLPSVMALGELSQDSQRLRALTLRMLVSQDAATVQASLRTVEELRAKLGQAEANYEKLISSDEERALYERFKQAKTGYLGEQEKITAFVRQDDFEQAKGVMSGTINQHADDISRALTALAALNRSGAADAATQSIAVFESARVWGIVMMLVAALITVALAMLLTRSIVAPLSEAVQVAEVVASGDLTRSIEAEGKDEPARLLLALRSMQQSLRSTIQGIADSSNQLASASEELHAVTSSYLLIVLELSSTIVLRRSSASSANAGSTCSRLGMLRLGA